MGSAPANANPNNQTSQAKIQSLTPQKMSARHVNRKTIATASCVS
jgi:hypothetical protein